MGFNSGFKGLSRTRTYARVTKLLSEMIISSFQIARVKLVIVVVANRFCEWSIKVHLERFLNISRDETNL